MNDSAGFLTSTPGRLVLFESLSDRFESVLGKLKGKGKLSEADVDDALREIRLALLEADVNVGVVRDVIERIRTNAVGATASTALNPGQQVVKIVHDELVHYLAGEDDLEKLKIDNPIKGKTALDALNNLQFIYFHNLIRLQYLG